MSVFIFLLDFKKKHMMARLIYETVFNNPKKQFGENSFCLPFRNPTNRQTDRHIWFNLSVCSKWFVFFLLDSRIKTTQKVILITKNKIIWWSNKPSFAIGKYVFFFIFIRFVWCSFSINYVLIASNVCLLFWFFSSFLNFIWIHT